MKVILLVGLLSIASLAALAAGCGGDGPGAATPAAAAPRNAIAFGAQDAAGAYGLYLVQPDGGNLHLLSAEAGPVRFPRWSPDGGRIAYLVGGSPERIATLRLYDFQTSQATTLSEQALASSLGPTLSWSPDGTRIAFVASGAIVRIYELEQGQPVGGFEVPGTEVEWSPAGDELAVVSASSVGEESDLYRVAPDGAGLRPLLEREGLEGDPRWSPDGRRLAFWSAAPDEPDRRRLLVLEPASGELAELAEGFAPAWSPDGTRLAYSGPSASGPGDLDILLVPVEGGAPQAPNPAITFDRWASWSPDGNGLTYLAQVDQQTAFVCVVQLSPEQRDCPDLGELLPSAPAWSPY